MADNAAYMLLNNKLMAFSHPAYFTMLQILITTVKIDFLMKQKRFLMEFDYWVC